MWLLSKDHSHNGMILLLLPVHETDTPVDKLKPHQFFACKVID